MKKISLIAFTALFFMNIACTDTSQSEGQNESERSENADNTASSDEESSETTQASEESIYSVRGQITEVLTEKERLKIHHENIEGFMKSMVMSFSVQDPAQIQGLVKGDKVSFDLVKNKEGLSIRKLEKLAEDTELALPQMMKK